MIICELMGGLGNQLFQYAYAQNLAVELGDDMCLDISYYNGEKPAILELSIDNRNTIEQLHLLVSKKTKMYMKFYHVLQYIFRKANHEKIGSTVFNCFARQGYYFNFDPFYYPSSICRKKNKYTYGYFQGVEYFSKVEESVRMQFVATLADRAKVYEHQILNSMAVALHIRMGDYQLPKNQYMNVCTDIYYANGIKYIENNVKKAKFFVFTNDIDQVKEKPYIPKEAVFVTGTKSYEDLMLMRACKHFVISGSTFSWWGSYLSEYEDKITVAPNVWMRTLREEPAIMNRPDIVRVKTD